MGPARRGAKIHEHTRVASITVDGRRCTTVHTVHTANTDGTGTSADIECEMLVNAAGMWGMEVGRMAGVRIPATAVEHQYLISGPIEGYTPVGNSSRCPRCATPTTSCTTSPTARAC